MSSEQATDEEQTVWAVNSAGEARDVDGRVATEEERRALMERLEQKVAEKRASTVEMRCLHALRQREAREQESQADDTTD